MFRNINEEIIRVKNNMTKKRKLERQLVDYSEELSQMKDTAVKLSTQLEKEQRDVKKLERISITNLISTITGTRYEKLDKEEQEVVAAQLKLEEANKTIQEIESSIAELEGKLNLVKGSEMEYEQLLKDKEELIKDGRTPYSNELYQLEESEADIQAYIIELEEAIEAGNAVNHALRLAIDALQSAKGWGTWDMLGGGMISSAIKHDHVDKATNHIHTAQTKMRQFQKELLDVNGVANLNIEMSRLLKFADFFFDGFIVDWMVQGRISDSLSETRQQQASVNQIVGSLSTQLELNSKKLDDVNHRKNMLIESL